MELLSSLFDQTVTALFFLAGAAFLIAGVPASIYAYYCIGEAVLRRWKKTD